MIIHKCDKCGLQLDQEKGEREKLPEGWQRISVKAYRAPTFDVCGKCAKKLGIVVNPDAQDSYGDKILDILQDIAYEAAEEAVEGRCP